MMVRSLLACAVHPNTASLTNMPAPTVHFLLSASGLEKITGDKESLKVQILQKFPSIT